MFHKIDYRRVAATLVATLCMQMTAFAGPPMFTDDPGIIPKGEWELMAAGTVAKQKSGDKAYELPVLLAEVGISENIMIGAAYPYVFVELADGQKADDWANLELGAKWRFYNSERFQATIVPTYLAGISVTQAVLGIGSDTPVRVLPVTAEYAWDKWTLGGELAWASVKDAPDETGFGIVAGRSLGDRVTLMAEIYGATNAELEDRFVNWNVGAEIEVATGWILLISGGSRISEPSGAEKLDYTGFLGIRYETGS